MQERGKAANQSHKRKSSESHDQASFQFVNANPQSEVERGNVRALVRANATRFHWRQGRNAWGRSRASASASARGARTSTSISSVRTLVPQRQQRPDSALTPRLAAFDGDQSRTLPDDSNDLNVDDDNAPQRLVNVTTTHTHMTGPRRPATAARVIDLPGIMSHPLLIHRLGTGDLDPFQLYEYPSQLPKQIVSPTLKQVGQFLLQLFPPDKGCVQSSLANVWLEKCLSKRGLFHAFLFCQLARNRVAKAQLAKYESPELLHCRLETVREVNEKFARTSSACDDDNILAVAALAFNGSVVPSTSLPSPYQGPLKALQTLDIYGGVLETAPMHLEGLAKMVSIRGGPASFQLPGLAQQISYGGIITASRKLTKPPYPYVPINPDVEAALDNVPRQSHHPLYNLGTGFAILNGILSPEELLHLYPVLSHLCNYTFIVFDYVEGTLDAQSLGLIADERNYVQYSLMSLTPTQEAADIGHECSLYELCRLAAVIYSLIVVFPLPARAAPFAELGLQVKKEMSKPNAHARWNEAQQLMLWVTVMAALASVGLSERLWFVSILDRLVRRLKVDSWAEMKEHLQHFLWYGNTSDIDGIDLWKEIEHSDPFSV